MSRFLIILLIIATLGAAVVNLLSEKSTEGEIRVAVASNFREAMLDIVARFEMKSGHKVTLIFGSTGKHYAQIRNGAPFDAFFAADKRRPELLENEGVAVLGSRFTYAVGQLVLWSPQAGYVDADGRVLGEKDFRHLAIANPQLAPYGMAATFLAVPKSYLLPSMIMLRRWNTPTPTRWQGFSYWDPFLC
ncbi:MAG: molybdate ABC transporter substrate-binding protein [Chloroflexi bacterium]|nr:molybdate ABC transporter substrate-binding protein [Chloroflexota bacterium]